MNQTNKEALDLFNQGIREKDTFLRNKAFNSAVEKLLNDPEDSTEYDILMGDNLAQLGQYPLALYYDLKALKDDPDNPAIHARLEEVIKAGNLPTTIPDVETFGPSALSIALVFGCMCIALSSWILLKKNQLKKLALATSGFLFLFLLYDITLLFRSPILAVIVHAEKLFQTPDENAKNSIQTPLPAGIIVIVLDVDKNGSWIKIRTKEGAMGYVPEKSIRLVD